MAGVRRYQLPSTVLTVREKEVKALLEEGFSGPEISRRLSISYNTFKKHAESIRSKLAVCQRQE